MGIRMEMPQVIIHEIDSFTGKYMRFLKYITLRCYLCSRRTNHDVLELVELSLDVNLSGNRVRYRFVDTPILDGISIYETFSNVVILVPTVCSVHRLLFPHPNRIHKQVSTVFM